jgi:WD40 repeat protein
MLQRFFCLVGAAFLLCVTVFAQDDTVEGYIAPVPVDQLEVLTPDNVAQLQRVDTPEVGGEVVVSPDERWYAVEGGKGMWVYDASDWGLPPRFIEIEGHLHTIHFSPDSTVMMAVCDYVTVCAWSTETGKLLEHITTSQEKHPTRYSGTDWVVSSDFQKFIVYGHNDSNTFNDGLFHIQAANGNIIAREITPEIRQSDPWSPDKGYLFTPDSQKFYDVKRFVNFFDANTGQLLETPLDSLLQYSELIEFTSDQQTVVVMKYSTGGQRIIVAADATSGKVHFKVFTGRGYYGMPYRLSSDGHWLAIDQGYYKPRSRRIDIWSLRVNRLITSIFLTNDADTAWQLEGYYFSPDNSSLITTTSAPIRTRAGMLSRVAWDAATGVPSEAPAPQMTPFPRLIVDEQRQAEPFRMPPHPVSAIDTLCALTPVNPSISFPRQLGCSEAITDSSGRWEVQFSDNDEAYPSEFIVRDLRGGTPERIESQPRGILYAAFIPDTPDFITVSNFSMPNPGIRVWSAETGNVIQVFGANQSGYHWARMTLDQQILALEEAYDSQAGMAVFKFSSWDTNGHLNYQVDGYKEPMTVVADGSALVLTKFLERRFVEMRHALYGQLHLVNPADGQVIREFETPELLEPVSIALSPNNNLLAAVDSEGWLYVWEVATGDLLNKLRFGPIQDYYDSTLIVRFYPDGKHIWTGGDLGRVWGVVQH